MLLSFQSTFPYYNRLKTNINIPWNCDYVEYYVASVKIRDILILTDDDYIEMEYVDEDHNPVRLRKRFYNSYKFTHKNMLNVLKYESDKNNNDNNDNELLDVIFNKTGQIEFLNMTHRAGLVTGLYYIPLNFSFGNPIAYIDNITLIKCCKPVWDLYNKLFLVSKQDQEIKSNIDEEEYNPSILANIDYVIIEDIPIIANFEMTNRLRM